MDLNCRPMNFEIIVPMVLLFQINTYGKKKIIVEFKYWVKFRYKI